MKAYSTFFRCGYAAKQQQLKNQYTSLNTKEESLSAKKLTSKPLINLISVKQLVLIDPNNLSLKKRDKERPVEANLPKLTSGKLGKFTSAQRL